MVINEVQNSIDFDKIVYDFERVKKGKIISTKFIYTGEKSIRSIRESCLCLSHRKTKFLDRTEITVWWNTNKSTKRNTVFKSYKNLVIFFDDNSFQSLALIAEIYE
jgi:hypothetical protein